MKKRNKIIILTIILFVIAGVIIFYTYNLRNNDPIKPIGGDKDTHGCLVGAGYSFDNDVGACTRPWELNDTNLKNAAKFVVAPLSYSVTVIEVKPEDCNNCFSIRLQRNDNSDQFTINISDGKVVVSFPITATNPISGKVYCRPEQRGTNIACTMDYNPVCAYLGTKTTKTYSNGCGACANSKVEYYYPGECS